MSITSNPRVRPQTFAAPCTASKICIDIGKMLSDIHTLFESFVVAEELSAVCTRVRIALAVAVGHHRGEGSLGADRLESFV